MNFPISSRPRLSVAYLLIGAMPIFSLAFVMRRLRKPDPAEIV
jgi:hypothetical protein